jgi:hypothetical protein
VLGVISLASTSQRSNTVTISQSAEFGPRMTTSLPPPYEYSGALLQGHRRQQHSNNGSSGTTSTDGNAAQIVIHLDDPIVMSPSSGISTLPTSSNNSNSSNSSSGGNGGYGTNGENYNGESSGMALLTSPSATTLTVSPLSNNSVSGANNGTTPGTTTPSPLPSVHNSMMHLWSRGDPSVISVGPATRHSMGNTNGNGGSGNINNGSGAPANRVAALSSGSNGDGHSTLRKASSSTQSRSGSHAVASAVAPVGIGTPAGGTGVGMGKLTFSPPSSSTFTAQPKAVSSLRTPQQYEEFIEKAKRAGNENTVGHHLIPQVPSPSKNYE